ncbi:hypothetical protein K7432_016764 [Basidiobolus ranarum]|uniref:Uncharacterized protein n=1 Tax=Basidiobolus ranarum TaxID=34480 RepID=A0ABR2VLC0_9FUNG
MERVVVGDLHSVQVGATKGDRQPSIVNVVTEKLAKMYTPSWERYFSSPPIIHATKYLSITITDVKGKEIGDIYSKEGRFSRNFPGEVTNIIFEGSISIHQNGEEKRVPLPSGTCIIKGLKPFGNTNRPIRFDIWTSAPFELNRAK